MKCRRKTPEPDRFWAKVRPEPGGGCWLWTGATTRGYGYFGRSAGNCEYAHRWSWEAHYGPIADDACVLHRCDVPLCVNPAHLFLGTKGDNNRDAKRKGRTYSPKLDQAKALEIRARYAVGCESQTKLASEYGVSQVMVSAIVNNKVWRVQ